MKSLSTKVLKTDETGLQKAADLLRAGKMVAIPTETVYGIAADATNNRAVAGIFAAKGRPKFNPLIVHVPDLETAAEIAEISENARMLADAFWPGPLTLVLPVKPGLADLVTAGLPTVAVRVPSHPVATALLKTFGGPIAAPSANRSGSLSPTTASHVLAGLGDFIEAVIDAGPTSIGLESTIVDPNSVPVRLLREGGLPSTDIERALDASVVADLTPGRVEAPGQLERHYATDTGLVQGQVPDGAIRVGFGAIPGDFNLSATGDLVEAASRLFATLHDADALAKEVGAQSIWVAEIPNIGIGRAINDRLKRACN